MKKIVYIAEFDQDVDDIVTAHWLHYKGVLDCVVLDPMPKDEDGMLRVEQCKELGIKIETKIPKNTDIVIVGGGFKVLREYLKENKLKTLIANGGFVGIEFVKQPLKKFKNKTVVRTFNFNIDVESTDEVLKSSNVEEIILVGKNVCHSILNTRLHIWKNETSILDMYEVNETKRLHDLLAAKEGLILKGIIKENSVLNYKKVHPYNLGLNGNMTLWGSCEKSEYNKTLSAIDWKEDI